MGYLDTAKRLLSAGKQTQPVCSSSVSGGAISGRTGNELNELNEITPVVTQGAKSDLSDKRLVRLLVPFPDMRAFHKWEIWRAQVRGMLSWSRAHPNCVRCGRGGATTRPLAKGGYLVLCGEHAGHLPQCQCGCWRRIREGQAKATA